MPMASCSSKRLISRLRVSSRGASTSSCCGGLCSSGCATAAKYGGAIDRSSCIPAAAAGAPVQPQRQHVDGQHRQGGPRQRFYNTSSRRASGTSSGFDDESSSSTSTSTPEEDYDLVDPRDALFASRREQRYFDDPAMTKPVLERSNTGMGYLVLNHDSTANYATSVEHQGFTSSSASSSWSSSSSSKNAVDGHGLYSVTDGPTSTTPSAGLDLPGTNLLIRKLRDLEVNSTKRFVVLTHNMDDTFEARERRKALGEDPEAGFVLDGISERDYLLLMAAEKKVYVDVGDSCNREPGRSWSTSRSPGGSATSGAASPTSSSALARRRAARMQSLMGAVEREHEVLAVAPAPGTGGHVEGLRASTTRVFDAFLQHFQELALLLADYRKPVLTLFPGHVRQEAVALLGFSEMSAACASTKVFLPDMRKRGILGGTSLLLSQNPIARFCALSRVPLAGADVVYGGIAQHYVSPDALEFLQLSAEKISFSVTEKDGRTLLKEHFLGLPDPSPWFLRRARLVQGLFNGAGRSRFLPEKLGDQTQHSQALAKALFVGAGAGGKTSGSARTAPASNVEVFELEKTRGAAIGGSEEDHDTVAHHFDFVWSDYVNTWDRNGARLLQQLSSQQATEADIDDARSFLDACLRFLRSEMPVTPIFALNWLLLERAHQIRDAVAVEAGDGQGGPGPGGGNGAGGSSGGGRTVNPVTDKEGHLHRARIVDALALPEVLAWELCAQRLVRSGKMDALITKSAAASRKQKRKQCRLQEQEQCGEGSESLDQHGEVTDTDRTHLAAADTVFREVRRLLDSEAAGLPQPLVPSGSCCSVPRVVESIADRLERTFERTEFALSAVPWVRRYHPDYDESTGSDHDVVRGTADAQRFSERYLAEELYAIKKSLRPDLVQRWAV